jgi:hypothetical protein
MRAGAHEDAEKQAVEHRHVDRLHGVDALGWRQAREGRHHEIGKGKEHAADRAAAQRAQDDEKDEKIVHAAAPDWPVSARR